MDDVDITNERIAVAEAAAIAEAQAKARAIPVGVPGECDYCGEPSERLVRGACCPCRDKLRLP